MNEKQILSRIIQKHDIETNWNKAANFIPMRGELIVYDPDENFSYARTKMGDGLTGVNDLPFIQVQSDWNQNDENALDYVKNRTHWSEITMTEILPECQLTRNSNGAFIFADKLNIVEGGTYIVKWNGVSYTCVAWSTELGGATYTGLGNGIQQGMTDTGEPFYLMQYPDNIAAQVGLYAAAIPLDSSTTLTISIVEKVEEAHKLDEKYLPDSAINIQSDWNATEDENSFILNRTHYTEEVLVEVIPENSVTFTPSPNSTNWEQHYTGHFTGNVELTKPEHGELFQVNWNGVKYHCQAKTYTKPDGGSGMGIGETGMFGGNGYPEFPFLIAFFDEEAAELGYTYAVYVNNHATEATFSVSKPTEVVHKIDEKYLPDSAINVQPDWNQNDETQPDYIKNRTHYINYDAVSVPPTQVNVDNGGYRYLVGQFEEGVTYNVIFDGVTYPCVWNFTDDTYRTAYLGNKNIAQGDLEDTSEPFVFIADLYYGVQPNYSIKFKENGTHTVGIEGIFEPTSITITDKYSHGFGPALVGGNTYKVKWNGVEYNLTATVNSNPNLVYLGNPGLAGYGLPPSEGNEPFCFDYDADYWNSLAIFTHENQENTFSIEGILPEQTRKFDISFQGLYDFNQTWQRSIEKNKEYTVILDGIEYKCICGYNEYYRVLYIGSEKLFYPLRTINDYPFIITKDGIAASKGTHEISVIEDLPVKIDEKFLPSLIGKKYLDVEYAEIFNDYFDNIASGAYSHAEGRHTKAEGSNSHAEGSYTTASKSNSHAEGYYTTASDNYSHAEGYNTTASDNASHSEGQDTIAASENQHAQGKCNIEDANNIYAHIVGNGTSSSKRSNAHTLDWEGNANFAGDVYVGNANENKAGKKLATEEYVDGLNSTNVKTVNGVAPDENGNVEIASSGDGSSVEIPDALPNPYALTFTGAVEATYDGSAAVTVEIPTSSGSGESVDLSGYYTKTEIDAIMGSYINDIDTLLGGDA